LELIASGNKFERLLAQGSTLEQKDPAATLNLANTAKDDKLVGFKASIKW
jgi:hypothetical protein